MVGSHLNRPPLRPSVVVLEKIRNMGELHVVSHRYSSVFEFESHREPAEWTQGIPVMAQIADGLVESATRNRALVSVSGTVEAGINLEKASMRTSGDDVTVVLPRPTIYEPVVDATLHRQRSGLTWDDRNLGLKARREGSDRFLAASRKAGILDQAEQEAAVKVTRLLQASGLKSVRIEFLPR
jgi:hypothetical protein